MSGRDRNGGWYTPPIERAPDSPLLPLSAECQERASLDHRSHHQFGDAGNRLLVVASKYVLDGTPRACRHDPGGLWALCAHHVAAGLLCDRCADDHEAGHPWFFDHLCDGPCGWPAPGLRPMHAYMIGTPPKVRRTHSGKVRNAARAGVVVVGLGLCRACCATADVRWRDEWVA